ncbi:MAG: hypothetical protein H6Q90_1360 [Deltaproteobacteria bacterium]|nr:hypothetical protein [Deltaproteobacteria bacterium]
MAETWFKCSACKTEIPFGARHWVCSVSTCNRNRMRLVFCSVACWDSHLGEARHRDAGAVEAIAPTQQAWQHELAAEAAPPPTAPPRPQAAASNRSGIVKFSTPPEGVPIRRIVGESASAPIATAATTGGVHLADTVDRDMMIVISKLKKYIKDRSGMNCSDAVADVLSDHVRVLCDDSIRAAARDERKTVLDRDVPRPRPR